jgi:hypothetical protein
MLVLIAGVLVVVNACPTRALTQQFTATVVVITNINMQNGAEEGFLATRRVGATAGELAGMGVQWHHNAETPRMDGEHALRDTLTPAVTNATTGLGMTPAASIFGRGGTPGTGISTLGSPPTGTRLFVQTPAQGGPTQVTGKAAVEEALKNVMNRSTEASRRFEFVWQKDLGARGKNEFREEVVSSKHQGSPMFCHGKARNINHLNSTWIEEVLFRGSRYCSERESIRKIGGGGVDRGDAAVNS